MRKELWRVRLDPGRPIGTTSAPPPANPSSNFPTLVGQRDSDKSGLRETGMILTSEPRADSASRRAVFLSTVFAVLLVASALTFAIYMTIAQKPVLARPAAAATNDTRAPILPVPPSLDTAESALSATSTTTAAIAAARPATTGVPANGTPPTATTSAPKPTAPPTGATTKPVVPAGKPAKGAASADLYKPF
jgi:hypothetical protein